ncbi:hypothetical protein ASG74_01620 [Knoellia sp. Soil729]|nr:hypothetical protein ASG74_01620 [Knoellia sp. Soil729]
MLTYRETKSLSAEGRARIMQLEVETSEPLRDVLRAGREQGVFDVPDVELASYNLLLLAHAWALKHWYFERTLSFEEYVARQSATSLKALLAPRTRRRYATLLAPPVPTAS